MRGRSITGRSVSLVRVDGGGAVAVRVRYDAARRVLVVRPRTALARGASYRVSIGSSVRARSGERLDQDADRPGDRPATWRFRTRG